MLDRPLICFVRDTTEECMSPAESALAPCRNGGEFLIYWMKGGMVYHAAFCQGHAQKIAKQILSYIETLTS